MTVVSNTSPLCYLAWIDELNILPALFDTLLIPTSVLDKLTAPGTPQNVRNSFTPQPDWLHVEQPPLIPDENLMRLHKGERDAILLAEKTGATLVLLDDRDARHMATDRGLNITGLMGVLVQANQQDLINLTNTIEKLLQTSFRISPQLLKQILEQAQS